jgi:hypothetical protein
MSASLPHVIAVANPSPRTGPPVRKAPSNSLWNRNGCVRCADRLAGGIGLFNPKEGSPRLRAGLPANIVTPPARPITFAGQL